MTDTKRIPILKNACRNMEIPNFFICEAVPRDSLNIWIKMNYPYDVLVQFQEDDDTEYVCVGISSPTILSEEEKQNIVTLCYYKLIYHINRYEEYDDTL